MANNTVNITNSNNTVTITPQDNNTVNTETTLTSVSVTQGSTSVVTVNTPGPQGIQGEGANIDTGSLVTTSSFTTYTGSADSTFAGTSSFATSASYSLTSSYVNPLNQLVQISGSLETTGSTNLQYLTASGLIYPTIDGERGDILQTDGEGNLTFERTKIYAQVKNKAGTLLYKGTPVHVIGSVGNLDEVIAASASNASTMPATFVLAENLNDDEEGLAILTGFINGVNTSDFGEGDVVYVGENGGYTNSKPTGSNLIQNLGIVTKVGTNGSGFIYGSGRSNDVPNLLEGNIFFGSGSDQAYITHISSALDSTTINNITSSGTISAITGAFSHIIGNSPIVVGDPVTFQYPITASIISASEFIGADPFPYTGSATISGSLEVIGDINLDGGITPLGAIKIGESASLNNNNGGTIAIGRNALSNHSTGYTGIAIGIDASRYASQPNHSVAIGDYAGRSVGTAHYTVYIGRDAGYANTGYGSTGIGMRSLRNGSGGYNTAVGWESLYNNIGGYNIAIGFKAGGKWGTSTTISNSTLLGYQAGSQINGDNNIALGQSSGYNASGSNNILIGYQAGYNLTGSNQLIIANNSSSALITGDFAEEILHISGTLSLNDGNNNTIIGDTNPSLADVATRNTLIGYKAGHYLESGSDNVFIGYEAGVSESIAGSFNSRDNVAIGPYALSNNNYGSSHIAIGKNALKNVTRNAANIAIGNGAGQNLSGNVGENIFIGSTGPSGGSQTIAIGRDAVAGNSSGQNIGIGLNAARFSGGSHNLVIGYVAGYNGLGGNTTVLGNTAAYFYQGNSIVALGYAAGSYGVGNNSIIIGKEAGYYASGSDNVIIGYQAGYNLTGSNQLIIANNSSSALITGDFANNTLDISGSVSASTYYGDGSNLTGVSSDPFPYTGSAVITGSNSLAGSYALKVTNTSGADILNIENDGNVGLGLADPSYKLQVRGATNDNTDYPFRVENSSGTPLFRVRSDGYVMFGNLGENLAIDFTGGNRYLKFFNSSISAQGGTGISATGTIGFSPGTGTSNKITFIDSAEAGGSVHLGQGTAANTTFPNDRGTEILFNREVNHQKHYGVIRGDDNQYQPVPIYIFSGQHTTTSVNQPLILQNLPGGTSRGNVGIGLEDPQTNLHVSGAVSASTYYGDGSNLTGIETDPFPYTGSATISGSLEVIGDITGSLSIEGSGSTLFEVNGSSGQLFSITDSLSGSLFAVSDVSGLPILEVFSDDTIKMGSFNAEALEISGSDVNFNNLPTSDPGVAGRLYQTGSDVIGATAGFQVVCISQG